MPLRAQPTHQKHPKTGANKNGNAKNNGDAGSRGQTKEQMTSVLGSGAGAGKGAASQLGRLARGLGGGGAGGDGLNDQDKGLGIDGEKTRETVREVHEGVDGGKSGRDENGHGNGKIVDLSSLMGLPVGQGGRILDREGRAIGQLVEGDPGDLYGEIVNGHGQILDEDGDLIGSVDVLHERGVVMDGVKSTSPKWEIEREVKDVSDLQGLTCNNRGDIVTEDGIIAGKLINGDRQKIYQDELQLNDQGEFWDHRSVIVGKAETVRSDAVQAGVQNEYVSDDGLDGLTMGRDGVVYDSSGQVLGRLGGHTALDAEGDLTSEDIAPATGNAIGTNTAEKEKHARFNLRVMVNDSGVVSDNSDATEEMYNIVRDAEQPVSAFCERIIQSIHDATLSFTTTNEDQLQLINEITPLITDAGIALQQCNTDLRALEMEGHVAAAVKVRSASSTASAEYQLAHILKTMAHNVVDTITRGREYLSHNKLRLARKRINPQWSKLSEPLFQIIASIGLLSSGAIGLFTNLLDSLWLGKVLRVFLGLGMHNILHRLGLERVLRGLSDGQTWVTFWVSEQLAGYRLEAPLKGMTEIFGVDRLVEAFRLGMVGDALELEVKMAVESVGEGEGAAAGQ